MRFSTELIEQYKNAKGYKQYKQVCADFGWKSQTLTEFKNGRSSVPEPIALLMGQACGIPDWEVVARLAEERAKTPEERTAWRHALKRLSQVAACVTMVVSLVLGSPNEEAHSVSFA